MVIGRHEGRIGEKNRIGFPKTFREKLGNDYIITFGFEGSLIIVAEKEWKTLLEGTEGRPLTTGVARETQRFLLGNATEVTLDEKGRFILPVYLKEYAQITGDVVFLGIERYIELWDKEKWKIYQDGLQKKIGFVTEMLAGEKKYHE